jgi:hypothetical protein
MCCCGSTFLGLIKSEQRETKEDDAQKGQCFVGFGAMALRLNLHEDKCLGDDQAPRVLAIVGI